MKRREFITLLGSASVAWPLAARAQQAAMPVIGFMSTRSPEESEYQLEAFRRGLKDGGYVEGQNVAIEFRWARGQYDRLPEMAAELVSRRVSVLTAVGGDPSRLAAKRATSTIPIVFGIGSDPVSAGLVESGSACCASLRRAPRSPGFCLTRAFRRRHSSCSRSRRRHAVSVNASSSPEPAPTRNWTPHSSPNDRV
jgi:hypothetical protein